MPSFTAIAGFIADTPPRLLERLYARCGQVPAVPSKATIWRVLTGADPDQDADNSLRAVLAVDGKRIRGAVDTDGTGDAADASWYARRMPCLWRAAEVTFVDLSRTHRVAAQRCRLAAVMVPRALLPLRDKDINELTGLTFDQRQPGVGLVTSVVREMDGDLGAYEGPAGARLGGAILDLISATLAGRLDRGDALPGESRRRTLILRIRKFIEDNLGDPELEPGLVAVRHHISRRHLHKIFEDQGTTVARLIRSRRLERCRYDLLDPTRSAAPVGAVAARWGFRDPAYFDRIFRAEFGLPPGEYRQRPDARASA